MSAPKALTQNLAARMVTAVAASYALDALLLSGFAFTHTVPAWIPPLYAVIGLAACAAFLGLLRTSIPERWGDEQMAAPQLIVAGGIQLLFVALVPQISFYFLAVLFIVFGFGSLRLTVRQSTLAWVLLGVAVPMILLRLRLTPTCPMAVRGCSC